MKDRFGLLVDSQWVWKESSGAASPGTPARPATAAAKTSNTSPALQPCRLVTSPAPEAPCDQRLQGLVVQLEVQPEALPHLGQLIAHQARHPVGVQQLGQVREKEDGRAGG